MGVHRSTRDGNQVLYGVTTRELKHANYCR